MSAPAPPELSARALIARIARTYLAPRWMGWTAIKGQVFVHPAETGGVLTQLVQG